MFLNNVAIRSLLIIAVIIGKSAYSDEYEYTSVCPYGPDGRVGGDLFPGDSWIPYNPKNPNNSEYWADHRGFAQCNCTSYAAQMSKIKWNDSLSNAEHWDDRAKELSWPISTTVPILGAVIQWEKNKGPAAGYGHVGTIADIDFDGTKITGLRYTDWNAKGDNKGPGNHSIPSNDIAYTSAHFIYTVLPKGAQYKDESSLTSLCMHDYPKDGYSVCWEYTYGGSEICENAQRIYAMRSDSDRGICYTPYDVSSNLCPPKEAYVGRNLDGNAQILSYNSLTGIFTAVGGFGGGSVPMAGPGYETIATDPYVPSLPDFIVNSVRLTTPWGKETYTFGMMESFDTRAQSENIGEGGCSGEITGHFYLSKGYKEDPHSGDGSWRRVDSTTTHCSNLNPGETHTETKNTVIGEWISEPGIYNIVYCIDHPQDDHNNGGDYPEEHESNNCSTEAVFEVKADDYVNTQDVNLTVSSVQVLTQNPVPSGGQMRLGITIRNIGTETPVSGIRSAYILCGPLPNSSNCWQVGDDGTEASELTPNRDQWEETIGSFTAPSIPGNYIARGYADYLDDVHETNETDNTRDITFQVYASGPDFVTSGLHFRGTPPTFAGDQARFGAWITNQGDRNSTADIRSSYNVQCPGTGSIFLADDGTQASTLTAGASAFEETIGPVTLPNATGTCTATFCADYQQRVAETREDNNCTSMTFTLQPIVFRWSSAGAIAGMVCTQIIEAAEPTKYTWRDNYFCSYQDYGMRWSSAGAISGMRCTQISEPADPYTWNDNFLCVPVNSPLQFFWSSAGPVSGKRCTQWIESASPSKYTWRDNYLCYD